MKQTVARCVSMISTMLGGLACSSRQAAAPKRSGALTASVRVVLEGEDAELTDDNEGGLLSGPSTALVPGTVLGFDSGDGPSAPAFQGVYWSAGLIGPIGLSPGDTLLATTGAFSWGLPCLQPEDNFASQTTTDLTVCADFTGVAAPVLEFDVLQLHGDAPGGFEELTTAARALRFGREDGAGEFVYQPIGSTPDGERASQAFTLPDEYVGALRLDCAPHRLPAEGEAIAAIRPEDLVPHALADEQRGAGEGVGEPGNTIDVATGL